MSSDYNNYDNDNVSDFGVGSTLPCDQDEDEGEYNFYYPTDLSDGIAPGRMFEPFQYNNNSNNSNSSTFDTPFEVTYEQNTLFPQQQQQQQLPSQLPLQQQQIIQMQTQQNTSIFSTMSMPPITNNEKRSDQLPTPEQQQQQQQQQILQYPVQTQMQSQQIIRESVAPAGERVVSLDAYIISKGNVSTREAQKAALIEDSFPGGLPLPAILNDGKFSESLIRLRRHKVSTVTEDSTTSKDDVNSLERLILRVPHKTLVSMTIEGFAAYERYLNENFVLNYSQKSELKYQKTLIRNREAVRETRKKSVSKISQLQEKVLELESSITSLSEENTLLKRQNAAVLEQNELLRMMVMGRNQSQNIFSTAAVASAPVNNHSNNSAVVAVNDGGNYYITNAATTTVSSQTRCNLPEIADAAGYQWDAGKRDNLWNTDDSESSSNVSNSNSNSNNNSSSSSSSDDSDDVLLAYRDAKKQKFSLNFVCVFIAFAGAFANIFLMSPVDNVYELYVNTRLQDMPPSTTGDGRKLLADGTTYGDPNLVSVNMTVNIRKLIVGFVITPFIVFLLVAGKKLSYKRLPTKSNKKYSTK